MSVVSRRLAAVNEADGNVALRRSSARGAIHHAPVRVDVIHHRVVGLEDRGTLEVGMKADLNLIDFEALQLDTPAIIFDLPAGGRRMFQGAQGYLATIVSGEIIMENGEYTGAVPGALIRGTQAAPQAA